MGDLLEKSIDRACHGGGIGILGIAVPKERHPTDEVCQPQQRGEIEARGEVVPRREDVVESLSEVRGRLVTGPTKTGARRTVTLPAFLAKLLDDHIAVYPSVDGYVFTASKGGPVRHHNFMNRHFYPAVQPSNLPEGLRFHDLRHTCAAILIARGWNPKQIQLRLGHSSSRTTLDRYGHLFEDHDTVLLDALDATFESARVSNASPSDLRGLPRRESGAG